MAGEADGRRPSCRAGQQVSGHKASSSQSLWKLVPPITKAVYPSHRELASQRRPLADGFASQGHSRIEQVLVRTAGPLGQRGYTVPSMWPDTYCR